MKAELQLKVKGFCSGCGELLTVTAIVSPHENEQITYAIGQARAALEAGQCRSCLKLLTRLPRLEYFAEHPRKTEFETLQSELAATEMKLAVSDMALASIKPNYLAMKEALGKIAVHDTLDGEKYANYESGWHGVAEFARATLEKLNA
jgi:hypothetical protein